MAALAATLLLLALYAATLAPSVTFWDAGEFIAAIASFGTPHPPGTPLYVLVGHLWVRLLGPVMGTAVASNLLSAVCTAAACGVLAQLVARWTRSAVGGICAALGAGTVATVWASATETEAYAVALLLAALMLACGDLAHRDASRRSMLLLAYIFALAPAVHLMALVAAPAAIVLAISPTAPGPRHRWRDGALLLGALIVGAGLGVASPLRIAIGATLLLGATLWPRADGGSSAPAARLALACLAVALLAATALLVMLVRARLDPAVNQGNPATWAALVDVVGRRQYAVAGLWPRQAPLWLQLGNVFEYADWQFALGLAPGVAPSFARTPFTVLFVVLAAVGARAHRRADPRSFRALLTLAIAGSLGVVLYLNLKAGPSYGTGLLAPGALREARERDYFFAFAFWTWGAWAGLGALVCMRRALAPRVSAPVVATAALLVAALPALLNYRAMDRRAEPGASLPRAYGAALLRSAPPRAVLFVRGDNDSYPLWYLQTVEGLRRDVTVVTLPLLGAPWYRAELRRRHDLVSADVATRWYGELPTAAEIARRAAAAGRPVVAAISASYDERAALTAGGWRPRGLVYVADELAVRERGTVIDPTAPDIAVAHTIASSLAPLLRAAPRRSTDPLPAGIHSLLQCAAPPGARRAALLDSLCNRR